MTVTRPAEAGYKKNSRCTGGRIDGGILMETQYFKDYSPALGRDMECKVYGHAGRPVLFIPCQDGRVFRL